MTKYALAGGTRLLGRKDGARRIHPGAIGAGPGNVRPRPDAAHAAGACEFIANTWPESGI